MQIFFSYKITQVSSEFGETYNIVVFVYFCNALLFEWIKASQRVKLEHLHLL